MRKNQASLTAQGIAMMRSLESEKPAGKRVIYDPYARWFVPGWLYRVGKFFTKIGYAEFRGPGVQGFLLARERYIDDFLATSVQDSIQQLVLLGAGFDARAYRYQDALHGILVFEVDHPATQSVKLSVLKKIRSIPEAVSIPQNVIYVPIDFNQQRLGDCLLEKGYKTTLKTLFIWQGVTQYLTEEAVDATLSFVRLHSGPGSAIVFDYVDRDILERPGRHGEVSNLRRYRGLTGEALTFGLAQDGVEEFLESRGFVQVKNALPADLKQLYFLEIPRPVASGYGIASGVVPE